MKYRKLGRTGLEISEIGMGLEHLLDKDIQVVTDTINSAINGGVNYFDCHPGHDLQFDSIEYEGYTKLGKALQGVRDKIYISYIAQSIYTPTDIQPRFENYLQALNTDHADVFILQFCDKVKDYEHITGNGGLLEYAQKLKSEKKIRFIGLSTHNTNIAHKVIKSGHFDVLMYPINPAFDVLVNEEKYIENDLGKLWDAAYEYKFDGNITLPRKNIYAECLKNNIGLVAMKPFAGGFLFRQDINTGFTPVNLISYTLNQTGISTVIPGCANKGEIEKILTYYSAKEEERDFSKFITQSRWNIKGCCQYCNHCLPCTANINIGQINRILDNKMNAEYDLLEVKASACVKCGECENRCPFEVEIIDKMESAVKLFE